MQENKGMNLIIGKICFDEIIKIFRVLEILLTFLWLYDTFG